MFTFSSGRGRGLQRPSVGTCNRRKMRKDPVQTSTRKRPFIPNIPTHTKRYTLYTVIPCTRVYTTIVRCTLYVICLHCSADNKYLCGFVIYYPQAALIAIIRYNYVSVQFTYIILIGTRCAHDLVEMNYVLRFRTIYVIYNI